jgi:hypothetical protein
MAGRGEQGKAPVQAVVELYKAIRDGRVGDVLALTDPGVVCLPLVRPGLTWYEGHEGMARLVADMHAVHGRYQVEVVSITETAGPQVTATAWLVPERGQPFGVMTVSGFRDGLISSIESFPAEGERPLRPGRDQLRDCFPADPGILRHARRFYAMCPLLVDTLRPAWAGWEMSTNGGQWWRLLMPREPKTAAGLRKLAGWLAAEHGIRAEARHVEEAGGRYRWVLCWYDGPADLPRLGDKAAELGLDTRRFSVARVITGQALAVIAARIAVRGDLPRYRDPVRLAEAITAEARSADYPERPADEEEKALATMLSWTAGDTAGPADVAALAIEHLAPIEHLAASKAPGGTGPQAPPARPADRLDGITAALAGLPGPAEGGADTETVLACLAVARSLAAEIEQAELALIEAARDGGATWAQIAAAMGARNRQTAQKRHADLSRRLQRPPVVDIGEPGTAAVPEPETAQESVTAPASAGPGDEAVPAPPPDEVPLRRRPAPGLGPEWAITGDDGGDITLWREDRRAGTVGRAPFSSGWEARRASGGPVTTLAAKGGRYPSRAKALAALAADAEHARRRATLARQVPLAAAGPGWQLAQTLADKDEGAWQVIAPDGTRAGTVRRSYPGARTWTATAGDPEARHGTLLALYPGADQAAPDGDWRTRDDAARAVAIARDPGIEDEDLPPASAPARPAGTGRRTTDPRITPAVISEGRYELVRAPDHAESRAWQVLVGGKPAGLVRPTWRRERGSRPGWEAADNSGMALPASGTGRVTPAGNARTRDAAAVSLLRALLRQQENQHARKEPS